MAAYLDAILIGLINSISYPGLFIVIGATLIAMATSFLPGLGSASLMSLLLLLTLSWSQESILLLFGALVGGATFMGSVTAILFNIPGSPPNAAALLDGYPLARRGFPRTAIACAATASAVGSVIGVVVLLGLLPFLGLLLPQLGIWEQLLLGLWGLSTIIAIPSRSPLKSLLMCSLGLTLAMVGVDPITGQHRFTFGFDSLVQGIGTIPLLLGLFTLAEIINWRDQSHQGIWSESPSNEDSTWTGIKSVFVHKWLTLRSSVLGTLIGIIPGVGGTAAGFIAYSQAQQHAEDRSEFSKGDIRGLLAPEAAMDAKDGGSLVPAIMLGLPGSEAGVFLLAAFLFHGMVPGAPMLSSQLPLTMTLIFALLLSNLLTSMLGVIAAPRLARLSRFSLRKLALPILLVSLVLIVRMNGAVWELYVALLAAFCGYALKRANWPIVPLIIAFVLGDFLERNFSLSMRLIELDRIAPLSSVPGLIITAMIAGSLLLVLKSKSRKPIQETHSAADAVIAILLSTAGLGLFITGVQQEYSAITLFVVAVVGVCAAVVIYQSRSEIGLDKIGALFIDTKNKLTTNNALSLLLILPVMVWAAGFHMALTSGMVFWAWREGVRGATAWTLTLCAAVTVGVASRYLLLEVSGYDLDAGFLATLTGAR